MHLAYSFPSAVKKASSFKKLGNAISFCDLQILPIKNKKQDHTILRERKKQASKDDSMWSLFWCWKWTRWLLRSFPSLHFSQYISSSYICSRNTHIEYVYKYKKLKREQELNHEATGKLFCKQHWRKIKC